MPWLNMTPCDEELLLLSEGEENCGGCAFTNCLILSRNYEGAVAAETVKKRWTLGSERDMGQTRGKKKKRGIGRISWCVVPLFISRHLSKSFVGASFILTTRWMVMMMLLPLFSIEDGFTMFSCPHPRLFTTSRNSSPCLSREFLLSYY